MKDSSLDQDDVYVGSCNGNGERNRNRGESRPGRVIGHQWVRICPTGNFTRSRILHVGGCPETGAAANATDAIASLWYVMVCHDGKVMEWTVITASIARGVQKIHCVIFSVATLVKMVILWHSKRKTKLRAAENIYREQKILSCVRCGLGSICFVNRSRTG